MKKKYILDGLECANCAAKIEDGVQKLDGVEDATVSFLTRKMVIECEEENIDEILKKAKKIIKKLEPDVKVQEG